MHYWHQLDARTDGAKTDGLARQVIYSGAGELVNPTKVVCVTGATTNRFVTIEGKVTNNCAWLIYVECDDGQAEDVVLVGTCTVTVDSAQATPSGYPIQWVSHHSGSIGLPYGADYLATDKYTSSATSEKGTTSPANATQLVIIRTNGPVYCVTISDADPAHITLLITVPSSPPSSTGSSRP